MPRVDVDEFADYGVVRFALLAQVIEFSFCLILDLDRFGLAQTRYLRL